MKQVVRRVIDRKGIVRVEEVPPPTIGPDEVRIASAFSVISTGTESATLEKSVVGMAKLAIQDPWTRAAVKRTLGAGGLGGAVAKTLDELGLFRELGYSGSGTVLEVGANVTHLLPGDRVAYAGAGHAEVVRAAGTLSVPVPEGVSMQEAAFVALGGIAMQGVRRGNAAVGETVAVIGMGLVGQIAAQILAASGTRPIGIDVDPARLDLASACGIDRTIRAAESDPVQGVLDATGGLGADVTIVCAASKDPTIANQAMKMTRRQGRVVFVGIVTMDLERMPFFLHELDLVFSRAYGPGVYDGAYAAGRTDYPFGYVRWTAGRNLESFLQLLAGKKLRLDPLIDSVVPVAEADRAYARVHDGKMNGVAVLLSYPGAVEAAARPRVDFPAPSPVAKGTLGIAAIGCGNFARGVLLPALRSIDGVRLVAAVSRGGSNAAYTAKRFGGAYATADLDAVLADDAVDAVLVATRHGSHAAIAAAAARAGKHVFLEKPAAMTFDGLNDLLAAVQEGNVHLLVDTNRRYSPLGRRLRDAVRERPCVVDTTVNIQPVPPDHWTLDPVDGGGRLLAEGDHFFDFMNFLTGSEPTEVSAVGMPRPGEDPTRPLNVAVTVRYADGSIGRLLYTDRGHPRLPRERVQVFSGGDVLVLDDFAKLRGARERARTWRRDMGHRAALKGFFNKIRGLPSEAASLRECALASRTALAAVESLRVGAPIELEGDWNS